MFKTKTKVIFKLEINNNICVTTNISSILGQWSRCLKWGKLGLTVQWKKSLFYINKYSKTNIDWLSFTQLPIYKIYHISNLDYTLLFKYQYLSILGPNLGIPCCLKKHLLCYTLFILNLHTLTRQMAHCWITIITIVGLFL